MIERAVATFGRLDMAFNNAGIQVPPSDAADETAENFDRVNAVNLVTTVVLLAGVTHAEPLPTGRFPRRVPIVA